MDVFLNNINIEIISDKVFEYKEFKGDLDININKDGIHTLIIYDMSENPVYVHYLVEDIMESNIKDGVNTIAYQEPFPRDDKVHEYFIDLYEQPFILNSYDDNNDTKYIDRYYDFKSLIRIKRLKLIKRIIINISK